MLDICVIADSPAETLSLLETIRSQNLPLNQVGLYFYLPLEQAENPQTLNEWVAQHSGAFRECRVIRGDKPLTPGMALNEAARHTKAAFIFFAKPGITLQPGCLKTLLDATQNSPVRSAAWEPRRIPYEQSRFYHPATLELPWADRTALLISRNAFKQMRGFEASNFPGALDIDLSWRLRDHGYRLFYVPNAVYEAEAPEDVLQDLVTRSLICLYLRMRFGSVDDMWQGLKQYASLARQKALPGKWDIWLQGWQRFFKHFFYLRSYGKKLVGTEYYGLVSHSFYGLELALSRHGEAVHAPPHVRTPGPLISVLIYSRGRTELLGPTLQSLAHQTHRPVEVVVAEDGPVSLEAFLTKDWGVPVHYRPLRNTRGFASAMNEAAKHAEGAWLVSMEEGDLLYADHLETLLSVTGTHRAAYSSYFELEITESKDGSHREGSYLPSRLTPLPLLESFQGAYPASCAAIVARELFQEINGLDERLTGGEIWDLWVRMNLIGYSFPFVPKILAIARRKPGLASAPEETLHKVRHLPVSTTVGEMLKLYPAGSPDDIS